VPTLGFIWEIWKDLKYIINLRGDKKTDLYTDGCTYGQVKGEDLPERCTDVRIIPIWEFLKLDRLIVESIYKRWQSLAVKLIGICFLHFEVVVSCEKYHQYAK
jgi:hypothetical protein